MAADFRINNLIAQGGSFTERPTVNGTGVLLEGDSTTGSFLTTGTADLLYVKITGLPVYQTGNQTISGIKTFHSGLLVQNGNVGIGTLTPTAKLEVLGDSKISGNLTITNYNSGVDALDRFAVDGFNGRLFGVSDSVTGTIFSVNDAAGLPVIEVESNLTDKITMGTYGSNALVVNDTKVGIGTGSPSTKLEILTSASQDGVKLTRADGERAAWLVDEGNGLGSLYLFNGSNSNTVYLGGTGVCYINAGNVGIGTTSPTQKLDVVGGSARVSGPNSVGLTLNKINSTNTAALYFTEADALKATIQTDTLGNFLIDGPNSVTTRLSAANSATLALAAGGSSTITFSTNGFERMRILSNGNVGIGTTTPTSNFQVTQSTTGDGTISIAAGGTTVTGVQTKFLNTFKVGDAITSAGQTLAISAIASDTSMTTSAAGAAISGASYTLAGGTILRVLGNGRVGIGVANPAATLDVYYTHGINGGTQYGFQSIINGGSNNLNIAAYFSATAGSGQLAIKTGNGGIDFNGSLTTNGNIIRSGNIFITAIPSSTQGNLQIGDSTSNFSAGGGGVLTFSGDTLGQGLGDRSVFASIRGIKENNSYQNSLGALTFGTQSTAVDGSKLPTVTEKMRILSNGNVGIGTTVPAANFEVTQPTSGIGTISIGASGTTVTGINTQFLNTFKAGNTIVASGQTLTISSIASNTLMTTSAASSDISGAAYALAGGSRFNVYGNGDVGVGTTTPTAKLSVDGGYNGVGFSVKNGASTSFSITNEGGGATSTISNGAFTLYGNRIIGTTFGSISIPFVDTVRVAAATYNEGVKFQLITQHGSSPVGTNSLEFLSNNGGSSTTTSGSANASISNSLDNTLKFSVAESISGAGYSSNLREIARFNGSGSLGIGTTTPSGTLHLRDITLAGSGSLSGSALNIEQTWNTTGTPTAIKLNVTDTLSNASSSLMDLQVSGISRFKITKAGAIDFGPSNLAYQRSVINNGAGQLAIFARGDVPTQGYAAAGLYNGVTAGLFLGNIGGLQWSNGSFADGGSYDLTLVRDSAHVLAQRNGINPQESRIYGTYTNSTHFERLNLKYNATSSTFQIGTEKGIVSGLARAMELQTDGATRMALATDGKIGIGTTSPTNLLHIYSEVGNGTAQLLVQNDTNTAVPIMQFLRRRGTGTAVINQDSLGRISALAAKSNTVNLQAGYIDFQAYGTPTAFNNVLPSKINFATFIDDTYATYTNSIINGAFVAGGSGGQFIFNKNDNIGGDYAPDVGISRLGVGKIGIGNATAGTSTGTLIAGSIGIGTTNPNAKLEISNASASAIESFRLSNTTASANGAGSYISFFNQGTAEVARIKGLSSVGGANVGQIQLNPVNNGVEKSGIAILSNSNIITVGINNVVSNASLAVKSSYNGQSIFSALSNGDIERFTVLDNGNVGIGNIGPTEKLDVSGNARISNSLSTNTLGVSGASIFNSSAAFTVRPTVNGSGVLLIGDSATGAFLTTGVADLRYVEFIDQPVYQTGAQTISGVKTFHTGFLVQNGNVGIGTTVPDSTLHINSAMGSKGQLQIQDTSATGLASSHLLSFYDNSGVRQAYIYKEATSAKFGLFNDQNGASVVTTIDDVLNVVGAGNVGIGTTSPTRKLEVSGGDIKINGTNNAALIINKQDAGWSSTIDFQTLGAGGPTIQHNAAGNFVIQGPNSATTQLAAGSSATLALVAGGNSTMTFSTNGTEVMRILSNGNVGIGTTTPAYPLSIGTNVAGTGSDFTVQTSSSAAKLVLSSQSASMAFGANPQSSTANGVPPGSSFGSLSSGGRTTVGSLLTYAGGATYINFSTNGAQTGLHVTHNFGSDLMTILSNGNVGIGAATPSEKLEVSGGNAKINGADSVSLTLNKSASTNSSTLSFTTSGSANASIQHAVSGNFIIQGPNSFTTQVVAGTSGTLSLGTGSSGTIIFNIGSSEVVRILTNGNVGIGTSTPSANLQVGPSDSGNLIVASGSGGSDGSVALRWSSSERVGFTSNAVQYGISGVTGGAVRLGAGTTFGFIVGDSSNGNILLNPTTSGKIGIGTISPTEKLEVAGNAKVSGHFSAATKSFLIPHPTKAGKQLQYGVVESDQHSVLVRGKTSEAVIELPEEWIGLVHEDSVTVQLTPIGSYQQLFVVSQDNQKIVVGGSTGEYNYTVYGERKDVDKLITEI